MKIRYLLLLFGLGLLVNTIAAALQTSPGYMDADYYYAGGMRLAQGHGFSEPFLWNFLDGPAGLPHPSHAYWMPLASILAAAGMALGEASFAWGRIPFLILAGLVPPLTAALAYSLNPDRRSALLAGLLAVLSGFYLPFLPTTDTFAIYMVLGGLFFLVLSRIRDKGEGLGDRGLADRSWLAIIVLGCIAGLMHLSRADGVLWLLVALIGVLLPLYRSARSPDRALLTNYVFRVAYLVPRNTQYALRNTLFILAGYLVVMAPWIARNLAVFGTPIAPGGSRALWLTNYDELYAYPASVLTSAHWLESGLGAIIGARLWALGQNLQTALAVQGEVFLLPLILLGFWRLRADARVRIGGLAWLLTFLAMTFVFPFQGARGGFLHSGAALQPLWWALAPVGLAAFVDWGALKRGWPKEDAGKVFGWGLVGLAFFLAAVIAYARIVGEDRASPAWNQTLHAYSRIEASLVENGIAGDATVLVNNPPGWYVATGGPAIPVPNGDLETVLAAARCYGARVLILEANHPQGLVEVYDHPGDRPGLNYLFEVAGTFVYAIEDK